MDADKLADEIDQALEAAPEEDKGRFERLKGEVKRYRERMQAVEKVAETLGDGFESFAALPEGDQQAIIGFATQYAEGTQTGDFGPSAELAINFARLLAGDRFDEMVGVQPSEGEPEAPSEEEIDMGDLSEDKVKEMIAEARKEWEAEWSAREQGAQQIRQQLTDLGYDPDPNDPRTRIVLSYAHANQMELEQAHKDLIPILSGPGGSDDDEAAGAAGESAGADEPSTTAPPEGVPTGGTVDPPKDFEEAGSRAEARLESLAEAGAFDD